MKLCVCGAFNVALLSRPIRGAWIEIRSRIIRMSMLISRAPYGARGLKLRGDGYVLEQGYVAPHTGRVD